MSDFTFEVDTKTGKAKYISDTQDIEFRGIEKFEFDGRFLSVKCKGDQNGVFAYLKAQPDNGERGEG